LQAAAPKGYVACSPLAASKSAISRPEPRSISFSGSLIPILQLEQRSVQLLPKILQFCLLLLPGADLLLLKVADFRSLLPHFSKKVRHIGGFDCGLWRRHPKLPSSRIDHDLRAADRRTVDDSGDERSGLCALRADSDRGVVRCHTLTANIDVVATGSQLEARLIPVRDVRGTRGAAV
jgi:hypothetical protein